MFTKEEIQQYAFGAVAENGRKFYSRGRISSLNVVGNDIVATTKGDPGFKVVISKSPTGISFDCTCKFAYGGACEHVVAAMLAANEHTAIQVGIDWDSLPAYTPEPVNNRVLQSPAAIVDLQKTDIARTEEIVDLEMTKPAGRIYLSERESTLLVELRFAYNEGEVEFCKADASSSRLMTRDDGRVFRIHRSKAREMSISALMADYDLIPYQTGFYTPVSDPRIWTLHDLPRLITEGFEIYGEDKLRSANTRKSIPRLSITIKSDNGFFDCNVKISFDGISATLAALVKAIRDESRFILLADGSSGILPASWIEKFTSLFSIVDVDVKKHTIAIREMHVGFADMLYQMADDRWADDVFQKHRLVLKNFEGIESQSLPVQFNAQMRSYQKTGYDWFYFLKKFKFGGCLADDMGLGKTIQTLALLQKEKELGEGQPSLVVVPTSLLFNWQREAQKFAPALTFLVYHGANRQQHVSIMKMVDIILTTYGTLLRDIETLSKIHFHYCILDEAQAIKNPLARISRALRDITSTHRLTLSGTPIENNLSELWSMFSFLNPGLLGGFKVFQEKFIKPIEKACDDSTAEMLKKLIFPFILRRTKEQAAKDLPPKNEIILYTEMLPAQQLLYDITKEMYRGKVEDSINTRGFEQSGFQVLEGLLRLRQICSHPLLFDKTFTGDSGKFRLVEESITDIVSEKHKILVFSQFVAALELLRERMAIRGITSEILTGSTRNRQEVVDKFQSRQGAPVFFISLKAGGTGLNLTSADYVFHIDPWWNPSAENQASDRAYRIGQTKPVFVYKIITRNSIEERVLELQERKRQLMDSVIQTESSLLKKLSKNDILDLFK
ncbi:MAG: SNF2 helicase associated domain-containing protein [Chitinispirillaceae bacterium]|nr:SNF2 helicase associated domain-containing protein [Chitinispirillaceae bacterium]